MRKTLPLAFCLLLLCTFFGSCKKDKNDLSDFKNPPTEINSESKFEGVNELIIAQNYLFRIITLVMNTALLAPEMHGLQSTTVETRTCPTVTFENNTFGNVMTIDFGTDCVFQNTVSGTPDIITGKINLAASGPITDVNTNTFLRFDTELVINGKKLKFVPGNPSGADYVKFQFFVGTGDGSFNYNAFVDGTAMAGNDPVLDRGQFQFVDCVTKDSLVLYPTYSGTTAFNFKFTDGLTNDPSTAPEYTYASLVNGIYEINVNPFQTLFYKYDDVAKDYELKETYNVTADGNPLLFTPLCKWTYGGKLLYDDIEEDDVNYGPRIDFIDNPFMEICFGSDANGTELDNCDRFVKVVSCDVFDNEVCTVGAETKIIECPQ